MLPLFYRNVKIIFNDLETTSFDLNIKDIH